MTVAKTSMTQSRSRSRSRSVRSPKPTESDPADEEEQEAFEFDPLVAVARNKANPVSTTEESQYNSNNIQHNVTSLKQLALENVCYN